MLAMELDMLHQPLSVGMAFPKSSHLMQLLQLSMAGMAGMADMV